MLNFTTGFTDDGLVFLLFEGAQTQFDRPVQSTITLEPDMAVDLSMKLKEAAEKAERACKRPLIVGQKQTFKKG